MVARFHAALGLSLLAAQGCTNTFSVEIENDSYGGEFTISSVQVWTESTGCTGGNILSGSIGPDSTVTIHGVSSPSFEDDIALCVSSSKGSINPNEIQYAGWSIDPGCTLDMTISYSSYEGGISYSGGPTDCPDVFDPFGILD